MNRSFMIQRMIRLGHISIPNGYRIKTEEARNLIAEAKAVSTDQ